jgi:hypothetical protein
MTMSTTQRTPSFPPANFGLKDSINQRRHMNNVSTCIDRYGATQQSLCKPGCAISTAVARPRELDLFPATDSQQRPM